jgi:hypothetical protein
VDSTSPDTLGPAPWTLDLGAGRILKISRWPLAAGWPLAAAGLAPLHKPLRLSEQCRLDRIVRLLSFTRAYAGLVYITLLYFEDCPSWREVSVHLEMLAEEDSDLVIHHQIVDTDQAAQQHQFCGSPSIHINGHDLFADPDAPVGLSCRIYQTPDGPAGSPTLEQVRHALISA